tara:strand:+ start:36 stop:629 length:594 start_codon:yes stop_codon:yes gene_type:complete
VEGVNEIMAKGTNRVVDKDKLSDKIGKMPRYAQDALAMLGVPMPKARSWPDGSGQQNPNPRQNPWRDGQNPWRDDAYRQRMIEQGARPWPSTGTHIYEDASWRPQHNVAPRPLGSRINHPDPIHNMARSYGYPTSKFAPNTYGDPGNREMFNRFSGGKMAPGVEEDILMELADFMHDPEFILEGMLKRLQSRNKQNK